MMRVADLLQIRRDGPVAHLRAEEASTFHALPEGQRLARAMALAQRIATNARRSNEAVTQALPRIAEMAMAEGLCLEPRMSAIPQGDDAAKQRVRAFPEGRAGQVGKPA